MYCKSVDIRDYLQNHYSELSEISATENDSGWWTRIKFTYQAQKYSILVRCMNNFCGGLFIYFKENTPQYVQDAILQTLTSPRWLGNYTLAIVCQGKTYRLIWRNENE